MIKKLTGFAAIVALITAGAVAAPGDAYESDGTGTNYLYSFTGEVRMTSHRSDVGPATVWLGGDSTITTKNMVQTGTSENGMWGYYAPDATAPSNAIVRINVVDNTPADNDPAAIWPVTGTADLEATGTGLAIFTGVGTSTVTATNTDYAWDGTWQIVSF
jgi:hypothetical protein